MSKSPCVKAIAYMAGDDESAPSIGGNATPAAGSGNFAASNAAKPSRFEL
jgi:hypothetical protein